MTPRPPSLVSCWLAAALCMAGCGKPTLPSADPNSTTTPDPSPVIVVSAPALSSPHPTASAPGPMTMCTDPRKTMCTKIYAPVCAEVDTGIRCIRAPCPSSEQKTYGNPCEACADSKVLGWYRGACEGG